MPNVGLQRNKAVQDPFLYQDILDHSEPLQFYFHSKNAFLNIHALHVLRTDNAERTFLTDPSGLLFYKMGAATKKVHEWGVPSLASFTGINLQQILLSRSKLPWQSIV